jgi:hypothetical protein
VESLLDLRHSYTDLTTEFPFKDLTRDLTNVAAIDVTIFDRSKSDQKIVLIQYWVDKQLLESKF